MFINKSDGEPAMKALKDAAEKALEGVESISQESPVGRLPSKRCHRVDSEDAEGTDESDEVCTGGWDDSLHMMIRLRRGYRLLRVDTIARFRNGRKQENGQESHWNSASASS